MSVTHTYGSTTTSDYVHVIYHCRRCGGDHPIEKCPQVKRVEFYEAGGVKWVEFFSPGDYLPAMSGGWKPEDINITP